MGIEADDLREKLEQNGELMIAVSEFEEPLELHLHDTEIEDETVRIQLTDGVLTFETDAIVGTWHHTHSLEDLGLED
ncbi:Uncharacterized protein HSR122_2530 [Halapricum desulfuricans]|uniref:Uncharacterized protein n=1 Tax=Halapricum desulfuricans TaxID=2841257 RepID=A0A897NHV0_9EURY|nr:hypothetical protein [Halapricum desulfuricans]QSG09906.1 Uncharacterized protein HSR122_2530 [Halapricum desulfuricans]